MRSWEPRLKISLLILLTFALAGCGDPAVYKAPVSKFRDASAVVIQSTKAYLTALNKTERDHYIYQQLSFRRQITTSGLNDAQVFSADAISARLKALTLLSDYTELLYQLANSDAPATIKAKASDLQTALTGLTGEVSKLTAADDTNFKTSVGKVFPIIGQILQVFVSSKIEEAIRNAIDKGTAPVNELIGALKVDVEIAYERKRQDLSGRRAAAITEYNREFEKGDKADPGLLRAYASGVSEASDDIETLLTAQPGEGLEAMKKANEALEKFAKTAKPSVRDLESFVDAVEAFANTARRFGEAAQALQK